MKVPVYRSQTDLPERTGAGQLSVQASPSAFGAVGAAQFGFGQTVKQEGLRWTEHFQKTDHALAVAAETKNMRNKIREETDKIHRGRVEDWTYYSAVSGKREQLWYHTKQDAVRKEFSRLMKRSLSAIPKRTTREAMATVWQMAIANAQTQTDATMRGKYMPYVKAEMMKAVNDDLKTIAAMSEGAHRNDAVHKLKLKLADLHRSAPFIGDDYMQRMDQNLESSAGEIAIRQQIDSITTSEIAGEWIRFLDEPKPDDKFFLDVQRLTPKKRQQLVERLAKLKTDLSNTEHNSELRNLKVNAAKKKLKEDATFAAISSHNAGLRNLRARGIEPGDSDWPKDELNKPKKMITPMEIDRADLSPPQRKALSKEFTGEDHVYNRAYVSKVMVNIWDAFTPDDLDEIEDDFRKDRLANFIGGKAFKELNDALKSMRGNTPEAMELKRYTKLIDDVMKSKNFILRTGPAVLQEGQNEAAGFASSGGKMDFANQVANGERPVIAYYNVMNKVKENRDAIVASQILTVPADYLDKNIVANPLKLRPAHIEEAMVRLRQEAGGVIAELGGVKLGGARLGRRSEPEREISGEELLAMSQEERGELQRAGKLPKRQRRTVRQLLAIEAQLNYLKVAAELYAKGPQPSGGNVPNDKPAGTVKPDDSKLKQAFDEVFDRFKKWMGDDEDKQ